MPHDRRAILPPFPAELPPMPPPDAALIDAAGVAAMLSISTDSVWRLDADGKLPSPALREGRLVRWGRSELDGWIDAGCPTRARWATMRASQRRRSA